MQSQYDLFDLRMHTQLLDYPWAKGFVNDDDEAGMFTEIWISDKDLSNPHRIPMQDLNRSSDNSLFRSIPGDDGDHGKFQRVGDLAQIRCGPHVEKDLPKGCFGDNSLTCHVHHSPVSPYGLRDMCRRNLYPIAMHFPLSIHTKAIFKEELYHPCLCWGIREMLHYLRPHP
jgi:hypothetical protein